MMTKTIAEVLETFPISWAFFPFETELRVSFIFSILQLELHKNVANCKDKGCSHPLPLTKEKKCSVTRVFH